MNKSRNYFEDIARKIDLIEHPELSQGAIDPDTYGEVDGNSNITTVVSLREPAEEMVPTAPEYANYQDITDIQNNLPAIDTERIDGVISLYKEFNRTYGLKFDAERINNIGNTFKEIIDPTKKEIFEIYLREYLDRLRLVCINQLGNTVYSLISKLTSEETIRSLTISERVALLDRLFEYMDKINNMVQYIPKGDTGSELREISERTESDNNTNKSERNRELEAYVLNLLKGTK